MTAEKGFMAIFAEITENERVIERHLRDIHPFLDYDVSLGLINVGLSALYGFSVRP